MGWNTQAELSTSGDFLAFAGEDTGSIYHWTGTVYQLAYTITPPGGKAKAHSGSFEGIVSN
jgi:hypothetical protein